MQSLNRIYAGQGTVRAIHYSCEGFDNTDEARSRKITTIGVYNFSNQETTSFSIVNVAEVLRIPREEVSDRFEEIERQILDDFYNMVKTTDTSLWVHWNMRDTYYGFSAIDHRARVLGLAPEPIDESRKVDLARVIRDLEGPQYLEHPRLENLLRKNDAIPRGFLNGAQEAKAFEDREFVKLHSSTLGKARAIWKLAELAASGDLQTDAKWLVRHGRRAKDIGSAIGDNWLYPILSLLIGVVGIAVGIAGFAWGLSQS